MAQKKVIKPVALAVGAALAGSFAISGAVNAADTAESPFSISNLEVGYMLGEGEGSCGGDKGDKGDKKGEGSCGEGSCGEAGDKKGEGSCGEKEGEGSCGEKEGEGSCGEKEGEGKCGEGSCGGSA
ncbi:MAG: hypothetical protein OEY37_03910 [Gammaproteobacteria bacterium]|nr:hypothetical protein [Gammaproteobacteria bacterium]MDH5620392.1 hypothetical protein [Gammaproteobacteria bacterium]